MDESYTMSTSNPYTTTTGDSILNEYQEMLMSDWNSTRNNTYTTNNLSVDTSISPYTTTINVNGHLINNPSQWITTNAATTSGVTLGYTSSWFSQEDNIFHNPTGPAAITKSDVKWYIDGKQIYSTKLFCQLANHTEQSTVFWLLTYGEKLPATPQEYKYLEADLND